ncbi:hypothetical protein MTO96_026016 [Rhipicephalus appendiculatus]
MVRIMEYIIFGALMTGNLSLGLYFSFRRTCTGSRNKRDDGGSVSRKSNAEDDSPCGLVRGVAGFFDGAGGLSGTLLRLRLAHVLVLT